MGEKIPNLSELDEVKLEMEPRKKIRIYESHCFGDFLFLEREIEKKRNSTFVGIRRGGGTGGTVRRRLHCFSLP